MHPAAQQPPQSRSCPSPSLAQCPSPSPSLIQQQQQHVLYGPITTLQPCPASLHPHCVYTGVQRNPGLSANAAPLTNQGKWQPKSKPSRGHHHQQQQYCQALQQQQLQQQPLSYVPKPLVLFDQCPTNQPSAGPPSATSFLVASSTFGHAPYVPGDQYSSASGLTLIPQPYFKPPDVPQAFCLLPERPQPQQQILGQNQGSYYNISAAINPKPGYQLTSLSNPYASIAAFGSGQISSGQAVPTSQIFQNPPVTVTFGAPPRDKLSMVSSVDLQALSCSRNLALPGETKTQQYAIPRSENVEWPAQNAGETSNGIFEVPDSGGSARLPSSPIHGTQLNSSTLNQEEHYSDESAGSFDFTIEAEKMVSALCNTVSSNELGKDESRDVNATSPSFSGAAGDNVTNKTNIWFADFCAEYGVTVGQNYRAASTQTQEDREDSQQYTESIRKTIYWGCNEAEGVLSSGNYRATSRAEWLANVCCATRTAVTKSSTCFPIYSGDRTFVQDLINAHLRISNGWLVLDNYLNKQQHYPTLSRKFDREFVARFRSWEVATHDLLREIVKTFVKIDENSGSSSSVGSDPVGRQENLSSNSFPGDVSLYVNYDLLDSSQRHQETASKTGNAGRTERDSTYTLQYAPTRSFEAAQQSQKETKLRSKWTITENLSSTIDGAKSIADASVNQSEPAHSTGNRFRVKNASNATSAKIGSSGRHSLNAEFVHLRNTVMESMGNCNELERQRWGMKERQYDFVFGASRAAASTGPAPSDPILKIRTTGSAYENAYTRRCVPRMNSVNSVNQSTTAECSGVYLVSGGEAAMDSTYVAVDRSGKTYAEPDYTGTARIGECGEYNCASGLVVSATSISSVAPDPLYVGKCSSDQRELAAVPRTKMTLLSQIEGNATATNKEPKEMTANLSAWFASMRNSSGHRTIDCPVEGRKSDRITVATRTSTHPQETSRSAMDLNRQLHMDGNRQLATLQNMQTIQSQPWNACNLLNNKRSSAKVRHVDEYDSSEDVRIYMKPGSYNVPKKRHNRKNTKRGDNPGSSRGNNHTPRSQTVRGAGCSYNSSSGKNHHGSTSVGSLTIVSSVQVSTTTTNTSTTIRVPFPATPIVPPPADFGMEGSTRILRRIRSVSDQETRQDVAWKAACASAEILLEALNVKKTGKGDRDDSKNSAQEPSDYQDSIADRSSGQKDTGQSYQDDFCGASSYEASEDDSDSTCKFSPRSDLVPDPRETRQQRTNVKTDSWLIRTLNNASIVSKINAEESDDDSTIGESLKSPINDDRRERQKVVTSTPERPNLGTECSTGCEIVAGNLTDSLQEVSDARSPAAGEDRERSASGTRQPIAELPVDTSCEFAGRATYSETVRRSTSKTCSAGKKDPCRSRQTRTATTSFTTTKSSALPVAGRKSQRKENDKTYQVLHKSRKTVGKRLSRDLEDKEIEDSFGGKKIVEDSRAGSSSRVFAVKKQVKKRADNGACAGLLENKSKTSDRGWSVWYSSRRRQSLSPLALNKLASIHQTLWQTDGAQIFKYPSANSSVAGSLAGTIEDYCRVIKNPMFLETIGYKLKNRIYHKAEHVVRDFRKVINNSKLYHKNDTDRTAKIEMLSKKLEDLFEEHFATGDFGNVSDSPKDDNGSPVYKSPQQRKSVVSRFSVAKKNPSTSAKNEN